jgi:RNA polymerase sigma-70 factor (ECF subfamily)
VNAEPPDEQLLARHLAGDHDAFTELVTRHERRVYSVCLRVLGNTEDAADATQDAFLALLRRASSFEGGSAFSTWLYRVAVNSALDLARRRARVRTVPLEADATPITVTSADPGDEVVTAVTVRVALARVAEEFRVALVLCDLCRLPYAEAAAILDVAVGTVKSRVFRGRAALARELRVLDPRARQSDAEAAAAPGRPGAQSGGPGATSGSAIAAGSLSALPGTAAALAASDEQAATQRTEE